MDDIGATVVLRPGREKPILNRHPWVFSGAVRSIDGKVDDGGLVRVVDREGAYLATGYLNRRSQIVVRILTWDPQAEVGVDFWRSRLQTAIAGRRRQDDDPATDAYRLVNAEADRLPGLVVDRYGDWLVIQCLTQGMARLRDQLVTLLAECRGTSLPDLKGIYARDDAKVRRKEGLPLESGPLWGEEPPDRVLVTENDCQFLVDLKVGHKTGFYLDQRANRLEAATYSSDSRVLNAFSYTGGFGIYAGRAGARSVVNIDTSAAALHLAEENAALNGCDPQEQVLGDVFDVLRAFRTEGREFDLIILDPPKFATSRPQVMAASRGYKDVNLLAMQLLRPGGFLFTFSCSGLLSRDLFQKIVFGASVDAGRDVQVLKRLSQGSDHPVLLTFPESDYLKGLLCRVW
ncbi:class I SAM-dependent rRNA methyltransferase [Chloroflexota bacterium]